MRKIVVILLFILIIVTGVFTYLTSRTPVSQNLDSYIYDLPIQCGTKYKVVQGYGGRFSHANKAAIDFQMPEGTPVCAARNGIIYSYKDDSDEGGIFTSEKKANYIIIRHEDGSFGCYWHLKKNGVVVKKGKVVKGQVIGYSGKTGFTLRDHLHFAVKRRLNYDRDSFVRTKFRTTSGIQLLQSGEWYERPSK
jgi:murein DD-endopeptidase MepM/ murein hydrolase activator NlpD